MESNSHIWTAILWWAVWVAAIVVVAYLVIKGDRWLWRRKEQRDLKHTLRGRLDAIQVPPPEVNLQALEDHAWDLDRLTSDLVIYRDRYHTGERMSELSDWEVSRMWVTARNMRIDVQKRIKKWPFQNG